MIKNGRLIALAIVATLVIVYFFYRRPSMIHALDTVKSAQDAIALFPKSVSEIKQRTKLYLDQAQETINNIIAIPDDQRTYENTVGALDRLGGFSPAVINASINATVDMVNPNKELRDVARDTMQETQNFFIENVESNKKLYEALKAYAHGNAKNEVLSAEQQRFIDETLKEFERAGLNLPDDQREKIIALKKEIVALELEFDKNIADDQSTIEVEKDDLAGMKDDFIASLKKTEAGKYIVGIDTATYLAVMTNCSVPQTRKKLWHASINRSYPANKKVLEDLIAKRYQLAQALGFATYAALELDDQMVKSPARAAQFIADLNKKAQVKAMQEFKAFMQDIPAGVELTKDGKLRPWDVFYLKNYYKLKKYNVDEAVVAEYFPMQETVDGLLHIYEEFLSLELKQLPASGLWDADVRLIEVIDKTINKTVGFLFLDLFPRPNKFNHACEHTMLPVTYHKNGEPTVGVVIVIANFTKPLVDKPSLLTLKEVNTFFHEFGHAMHALLGRTAVASFAGTRVKRDFVEMPSQMLEEWLWNPDILKMVSKHYQTGQPLPDDLIASILRSRTFDSGFHTVRQLYLAKLSLDCFNNGPQMDLDALIKKEFNEFIYGIQFEPTDHQYASFGHLTGYGARYYGYMWSSVFAHDLFSEIKKAGLLNSATGQRYIKNVIGKGGSKDPNDLLKDFLGREPNQEAFLLDMGF